MPSRGNGRPLHPSSELQTRDDGGTHLRCRIRPWPEVSRLLRVPLLSRSLNKRKNESELTNEGGVRGLLQSSENNCGQRLRAGESDQLYLLRTRSSPDFTEYKEFHKNRSRGKFGTRRSSENLAPKPESNHRFRATSRAHESLREESNFDIPSNSCSNPCSRVSYEACWIRICKTNI